MSSASSSVSALFVATVIAVAGAFVIGAYYAARAGKTGSRAALLTALAVASWLAISAMMASKGWLVYRGSPPPPLARMVLGLGMVAAGLTFSRVGRGITEALPLAAIVGFQAFRIPVEVVLAALHREGLVPAQMTYAGLNFDIVSGLSAIVVAVLAMRGALPRWALLVWNVAGTLLLLTIVVIANLASPGPLRIFDDGPEPTILITAPYVWLPAFLVPGALFGHLLVFRRLFARETRRAAIA